MFIQTDGYNLRVVRQRIGPRNPTTLLKLILLINRNISQRLTQILTIPLRLQVPRLHTLRLGTNLWLKGTLLKLFIYLFESHQIFFVGIDVVELVELGVTILLMEGWWLLMLIFGLLICTVEDYFSIPFRQTSNNPKESQLLFLLLTQKLAIKLNKLKKDPLQQILSLLNILLNINNSNHHIINQSSRHIIISKINQFQYSPSINNCICQK